MYQRIESMEGAFVGLHIQKDISDPENQELLDLIEQRFRQHGPVRLLVIYAADTGLMGAESLYDNMRFAKLASDKLARMAVIGERDWESTWISLFGLFGGIEASYFRREAYEEALAWLNG